MKRIIIPILCFFFAAFQLFSQKDLPVFAQYSSCYLNSGLCNEVYIQNEFAYIGCESGLLILNISNPSKPVYAGNYIANSYVDGVFVSDNTVFLTKPVAVGPSEVDIVDITDPAKPTLINTFETGDYSCKSMLVHDTILFLSVSYSSRLLIYNISNLLSPVLISELPDIKPIDMVARDNYLYLVDNWHFGVLDISNISDPQIVSWIGDYSTLRSNISIQGNFAYLTGYSLDIFDITDPENPVQLCDFETEMLRDIEVNGQYCYTHSEDSLYIINVEDAVNPIVQHTYPYEAQLLDFNNNLLMVTTYSTNASDYLGVAAFSVDSTQEYTLLSEYLTDRANDVCISDNHAYVANGYRGLKIINIVDPSNPIAVSEILVGNFVYELIIDGIYAYIRTSGSMEVVDISIPSQPVEIGSFNYTHYPSHSGSYAIEKYQDYVYLGGDGLGEIFVIDVSDPYNPSQAGMIDVYDWSPDISVHNDHLYVAGYWGGLEIFDLADPVNPPLIGNHPLGLALLITVENNKVFIGGDLDPYSGGIELFDVTDLTTPVHAGTYPMYSTDLESTNKYLFAGQRTHMDLNSSIQIVDISDIYNPYMVQEINHVAPNGIYYENDMIFAVEDFEFKIFGDSISVNNDENYFTDCLSQLRCYPNPFRTGTNIKFRLDDQSNIKLMVYNCQGKLIDELMNSKIPAGNHHFQWFGKDQSGILAPAGIYIIVLQTDKAHITKKVIKIRE